MDNCNFCLIGLQILMLTTAGLQIQPNRKVAEH